MVSPIHKSKFQNKIQLTCGSIAVAALSSYGVRGGPPVMWDPGWSNILCRTNCRGINLDKATPFPRSPHSHVLNVVEVTGQPWSDGVSSALLAVLRPPVRSTFAHGRGQAYQPTRQVLASRSPTMVESKVAGTIRRFVKSDKDLLMSD